MSNVENDAPTNHVMVDVIRRLPYMAGCQETTTDERLSYGDRIECNHILVSVCGSGPST
jgi:hypothetical protein